MTPQQNNTKTISSNFGSTYLGSCGAPSLPLRRAVLTMHIHRWLRSLLLVVSACSVHDDLDDFAHVLLAQLRKGSSVAQLGKLACAALRPPSQSLKSLANRFDDKHQPSHWERDLHRWTATQAWHKVLPYSFDFPLNVYVGDIPLWHNYHHGMRCASGHHRAVASTELVASCLIADGWNVRIEHWDLGDNYPACGCPDACTRRNPPELLDEWHRDGNAALVVAYRLWRSIAPP